MRELLAIAVFLLAYGLIVSGRVHRTIVALFGGVVMIFLGVFSQPQAIFSKYVDFNTIFLLFGMMVLVALLKETGLFEFLGVAALRISKGSVLKLYLSLVVTVGVVSAVIDNVTTMLVIVPITFAITDTISIDPVPILIGEIFSSNIGGAATLIGDPPNVMIGSAAGLTFTDFLFNLGPILLVVFVSVNLFLILLFRKSLLRKVPPDNVSQMGQPIRDKKKFALAVAILAGTVSLFIFQQAVGIQSSIIALFSAMLAAIIFDRKDIEKPLKGVEWSTLIFFIGLFIMVGGLQETGVLEQVAKFLMSISGNSLAVSKLLFLNVSGFISAFVDNIPYTATMIPVIQSMQKLHSASYGNLNSLWWSLSLGVCLGGNGTAIGASANVVGLALLKKFTGTEISFLKFLGYGIVVLLLSLALSSFYVVFVL